MGENRLNIFHLDFNYSCLKPDFLREWLHRVADMGFNAILWELEDKVCWETCPECVWPEAMSKDEFRELLAYSRDLGLEPIPLLQTIGHAEYVLIHDEYRRFREIDEFHDCYCTSNPDVVAFLKRWLEEYLDLFGNIRYFHLGGDEAHRFGKCPVCAKKISADGPVKLYSEHVNAIAEPLFKKGIRPGIWNDMIIHHPDAIGAISRDFVIWDWNYWDTGHSIERVRVWGKGMSLSKDEIDAETAASCPEVFDEKGGLRGFYTAHVEKRYGFDVILCSSSRAEADNVFCPRAMHAANISAAASTVAKAGLFGNCVTSWAVRMHDLISQIPSLSMTTPSLITPDKDSREIKNECLRELFGANPEKFIAASEILGISLPFAMAQTTGIYWNGLKDNLPTPPGYLKGLFKLYQEKYPEVLAEFPGIVEKCCREVPCAIAMMSEFSVEASRGHEIIEHWLTAAHYLLQRAIVAKQVLTGNISMETVEVLKKQKEEYCIFLRRSQSVLSSEKNAARVFDSLIDYCQSQAGCLAEEKCNILFQE